MLWLRRCLIRGRNREQENDKTGVASSLPLPPSHQCSQHQDFKVLGAFSSSKIALCPTSSPPWLQLSQFHLPNYLCFQKSPLSSSFSLSLLLTENKCGSFELLELLSTKEYNAPIWVAVSYKLLSKAFILSTHHPLFPSMSFPVSCGRLTFPVPFSPIFSW